MTLQRKTLLVFSVSFIGLLAVIFLASTFILQKNLRDSEQTAAQRTLLSSHGLLKQTVDEFNQRFADWAAWDDAADFVQTRSSRFIQSNLLDESLAILNIHTIIFLDAARRPVYATGFDTTKVRKTPVPPAISELLKDTSLTTFKNFKDSHQGIVIIAGKPMMVTLHPIVTTALKGPQRGTLMVGRYVDDEQMKRISEWGGAQLSLRALDDKTLTPEFAKAKLSLLKNTQPTSAIFTQPLDEKRLVAYKLLNGLRPKPSLILQAVLPRDAYANNLVNLRYLVLALLISTMVFGLVTVVSLRQLVLKPLVDLSDQVHRVREGGNAKSRVTVAGERELADLASSINGMLAALEYSETSLHESIADLRRVSEELALVGEMGNLLQSCRTREEAVLVIGQSLRRLYPDESGALCIMNPSQDRVEVMLHWGDAPNSGTRPFFAPDDCWSLRRGRAHVMDNPKTQMHCAHLLDDAENPALCLPLMAERQTLGVLHLRAQAKEPWPESKLQLARTVSEQISLALLNLELQATLRNQSVRDPLTGLFNRRYMEESLARELSRAERQKHQVAMILFDADHFKRFNDTFGHEAGDLVLKEIAQVLQSKSRKMDIACRYGGEEFLLILPNCPMDIAIQRAEQLRQAARELSLTHEGQRLGQVTLSLGVACYPDHANTGDALVRATDGLLYQAKKAGRDRVMSAPQAMADNR